VCVREDVAGQLEIRYRDRVIRWTELASPAASKAAPAPSRPVRPAPEATPQRRRPCADHPWHHVAEDHRAARQLAAARRAWEAVQP
jgi:hypothetical protein